MLTLEETIDAISSIDATPAIIKEASKRVAKVEFDENLKGLSASALAVHILQAYTKKTNVEILGQAGIELAAIILANIVKTSSVEKVSGTVSRLFTMRFYDIFSLRLLKELEEAPDLNPEDMKEKIEVISHLRDRIDEMASKQEDL
jgi:hypothetical protein